MVISENISEIHRREISLQIHAGCLTLLKTQKPIRSPVHQLIQRDRSIL